MPTPKPARQSVSVAEIMKTKTDGMNPERRAALMDDFVEYRPRLYKQLQLPSYVHAYSLAIEYMQEWYLSNFPKNYFKYVYLNGKHVLDDWRQFNRYNIKHEKPMLAIIPSVNTDWDRDNVDMYMGTKDLMLRRSTAQQSFFRDYERMQFLYLQMREMEMNFTFRNRVSTRSQQLDLYNKMELWFRNGTTQTALVNADFHIPKEIIQNIAQDAYFDLDNEGNVINIIEFSQYMNTHSDLPVLFKLRAINQKPEWFIRATGLRAHIAIMEKLQLDDGERSGKLDTNFHVEMNCRLRIPIPHFYAYMSQDPIKQTISVREKQPSIGIYTIEHYNFPPQNENGWPIIAQTSYLCDKGEQYIDFSPLFRNSNWNITKVIEFNNKLGINSNACIDVKALYSAKDPRQINYHIDFNKMKLIIEDDIDMDLCVDMAIYADMNYINNTIINIENYDKSRIQKDKQQ